MSISDDVQDDLAAQGNVVRDDLGDDDPALPPLDMRVIRVVRAAPTNDAGECIIRPARLSSELGLSLDAASAELSGLMAAVGGGDGGARFFFEVVGSEGEFKSAKASMTMVFAFPPDFEARAFRTRRREDLRSAIGSLMSVSAKLMKAFVALGLIISLAIATVLSICVVVAAVVAMMRGSSEGHHRSQLMRRVRSLTITLRQLLWCYVVFGGGESQDPFLRDMAYDIGLFSSIFCGSPFSAYWWIRAGQIGRRRRRMRRGWGSNFTGRSRSGSGIEGVALVSRGTWSRESREGLHSSLHSEECRGILSVAVEFLFGPEPFFPGPNEEDRWRLRAAVIVSKSVLSPSEPGIALVELLPYADKPPAHSINCDASEGLRIASYFNGIANTNAEGNLASGAEARFAFPELVAEADDDAIAFVPTSVSLQNEYPVSRSWESLLYSTEPAASSQVGGARLGQTLLSDSTCDRPPSYLRERQYCLTQLSKQEFLQCCTMVAGNLLGLYWIRQSLCTGGVMGLHDRPTLMVAETCLAFLIFYAKIFLLLPVARLGLILVLNHFVNERNDRRKAIADELEV